MKLLKLLPVLFCLALPSFGATDTKVSALPKLTNALPGDLFPVSSFLGGVTNSKAISVTNIHNSLLNIGRIEDVDSVQTITGRKKLQDSVGTVVPLGNKSGAITLPWNTNGYSMTLTGPLTVTMSGSPPTSGDKAAISLFVLQDATGGRLLTNGTSSIIINTNASAFTTVALLTLDGGTTVWSYSSGSSLLSLGAGGSLVGTPSSGVPTVKSITINGSSGTATSTQVDFTISGSGGGETQAIYVVLVATNTLPNAVVISKITNGWKEIEIFSAIFPTNGSPATDTGSNYVKRVIYPDTVDSYAYYEIILPPDYGTNGYLWIQSSILASPSVSPTNVWAVSIHSLNMTVTNNVNVNNWGTEYYYTNIAPATASGRIKAFTWLLGLTGDGTSTNAPGDKIRMKFGRKGTSAGDTPSSGSTVIHGMGFGYTRK